MKDDGLAVYISASGKLNAVVNTSHDNDLSFGK
jgi:hypothetical protein